MRGEVHILVNCPIDTFLKEKQHSALYAKNAHHVRTRHPLRNSGSIDTVWEPIITAYKYFPNIITVYKYLHNHPEDHTDQSQEGRSHLKCRTWGRGGDKKIGKTKRLPDKGLNKISIECVPMCVPMSQCLFVWNPQHLYISVESQKWQ